MDKRLVYYYAVDSFGQGRIYNGKPVRDDSLGLWKGDWNGNMQMVMMRLHKEGVHLPTVTWRDEPVELKMSFTYG